MRRRLALLTLVAVLAAGALPAGGAPDLRPPTLGPPLPGDSRSGPGGGLGRTPAPPGRQDTRGPTPPGRQSARGPTASFRPPWRLAAGERFTWATYRPAAGSGLMALSGPVELGFGQREGTAPDVVPGVGVPPLPANFSPNVLVNQDLASVPHNETSVAINPKDPNNILVGANDYRIGFASSGFYATTDGGRTWRDGILPLPSVSFEPIPGNMDLRMPVVLDGGGDPAVAFDRAGTAYFADINFSSTGCVTMVLVYRSVNGGLTWNRPLFGAPLPGDTRTKGDGIVVANENDNDCGHFYDKEYIAVGPRPAGGALVPRADEAHLSPDRLYVTYTDFQSLPQVGVNPFVEPAVFVMSPIMVSYSDDQGRHWSAPKQISGATRSVCPGSLLGCVNDQASVPVVDPRTGKVYVYFLNSDTGENPITPQLGGLQGNQIPSQILAVASSDGGATWSKPVLVAPLVDDNLPLAGEDLDPSTTGESIRCPDQQPGRQVLGDTCFRWAPYGNITLDGRTGRLYAVWSDNRNGTNKDGKPRTDTDIFVSTSMDGLSWSEARRVNTDPLGNGKDQFFPWAAVAPDGILHVSFLDRAGDPRNHNIGATLCLSGNEAGTFSCASSSTGMWDPDLAFRKGLFIGDYTGIAAGPTGSFAAWPDARRARPARQGDNPSPILSEIVGSFSSDLSAGGASAASSRGATAPRHRR